MDEILAAGTAKYDIRIEEVQRAEVYVDTHEDVMRWIKWLVELGYRAFGPFQMNGKYRIDFTIIRKTVADTRRGDAVAFDGRYTVK